MKKSTVILLILIGLLTGSGVAVYRITHWTGKDAPVINGSWMGHNLSEVGSNRLLTARIAVAALFALNPKEVIYMVATTDSEGEELTSENDYILKGVPLDARYWSITFYDDDYFLVPNKENRFSYNMNNIIYESDSSFVIAVSSHKKEKNWLPAGGTGKFYLAIRMYHPEQQVYKNMESIQLPVIEKVKR